MSAGGSIVRHELQREPGTGFIRFVLRGPLDETDAVRIIDEFEQLATPGHPVFVLGDTRQATHMTSGARKAFGESNNPAFKKAYFAGFGASFAFRIVANMALKTMAVLSSHTVGALFNEEADARAWLLEKQQAYLARSAES